MKSGRVLLSGVSVLLCMALVLRFGIGSEAHPAMTFIMSFTDDTGNYVTPDYATGEVATMYFVLQDTKNNMARVTIDELMIHHDRYMHVIVMSADEQTVFHLHPEDFGSVQQMSDMGAYYVKLTFPYAGYWTTAVDFMFMNSSGLMREGLAMGEIEAVGTPPMQDLSSVQWDYNITRSFRNYSIGPSEVFDYPIFTQNNTMPEGYIISFTIGTETIDTGGNINITGNICVPVYVNVLDPEGHAATLVPFLAAAIHFTMGSPDDAAYHAHGMYLPEGMTVTDVADVVINQNNMTWATENGYSAEQMTNITYIAMMTGFTTNGSLNCLVDGGQVMNEIPSMTAAFYGPPTFGPTVFGLFDFPLNGTWRIFAWLQVRIGETDTLLIPDFAVNAYVPPAPPPPTSSTSSTHSMSAATSVHILSVGVACLSVTVAILVQLLHL